ncbi:MAG TPA: sulfate ABC transporter ATP-binding protein [Candidatus Krumholzibacteria bacterium]|nr:sulfate ABC transporter ATP-binding protein [Candidatus Krumholzibacteria bacterium]HPD72928.1 sulfate ABC transporter ATP-binding protein [Candidatus Krumholzibacteria bacterium]HRY41727.1 sulfate ABC transporter ATP-binding protein [Candidatus Krumholzibacteria bacterium]
MGITVEHISKTYGNFTALRDVSLEIRSGQLTALLGPSGSGKTTLLRIIAGLEIPDPGSGAIRFSREDMADRRVQERRVGFVFQHYALFRHLTVFENVAFGLRVRPRADRPSRKEIAERVHTLLDLVQLDGMAERYPSQLSGGQRQRVALARALAVEPKVLLLDEPFGALDARVRKQLRAWLRHLHQEIRVTSVFVTHDQDEALEVADHVVIMNEGRIEQEGTPESVFHQPATEFVMNFLGDVNVFHARVEDGKISFASLRLDAPGHADSADAPARVFVRPHELDLAREPGPAPSLPATVLTVHAAGPTVRLQLRTPLGETLVAVITQARFRDLDVKCGDQVHVAPRDLHVFLPPPDRAM